MSEPWTYSGKVTVVDQASGVVTLVDESTFAISGLAGDMVVGSAEGLFVRDTRILSRMELRVNGARPEADDTEPIGVAPNDVQRLCPDRSRGAEDRNSSHDSPRGYPAPPSIGGSALHTTGNRRNGVPS